ncbi:MAG TPA: glycoside hydrolase family 16 protein [Victivallales bacterium]|nr:glycoside hydrolase family 16 protein [Victivallales bacterium]HPO89654.1 glycoside hydrolase family 16 protein [Victivallales bacterium]HRR06824.1 glycoside hydrolase family 16 protein [Victivallales bacterium]HRR27782.1 glycoside hydrolase family 16 protein [Victivallales bacterium]
MNLELLLLMSTIIILPTITKADNPDEWKLIWCDEFNNNGLPDPTKWNYEYGFVRNEEKQYYTRERMENARVENGLLIIECRKEKFKNHMFKLGSNSWKTKLEYADYTAASIITKNKFSVKYGRIEVKAKLPHGQGVWPAIWMLGDSHDTKGWPTCGEIDIMEFVGKEPGTIHGTVHFAINGKHKSKGGKFYTEKPFDDFHIYAIEWNSEEINFFFDENKYFSFNVSEADEENYNPFREPFYILMNFAIGGTWGGKIDDNILPQQFIIDYIRVYQKIK